MSQNLLKPDWKNLYKNIMTYKNTKLIISCASYLRATIQYAIFIMK